MRANLPDREYFIDKPVPGRPDLLITEYVKSGNNAHVFKARLERTGRDVACKIIPRKNLADGGDTAVWEDEVRKADALENSVVVKCEGVIEWKDSEAGIDCIVLVFPFIEGRSLRDTLADKNSAFNVASILICLETLLELLAEMNARGISHGDLHTGNIIVEHRRFALRDSPFAFRVTDFGVADVTSDPGPRDDFHQVGIVLNEMLRAVDFQAPGAPDDKFIFLQLRDVFVRYLTDDDPTRNSFARQARLLFEQLRSLPARFRSSDAGKAEMTSPFDFLSCEQIGDASLLEALYSNRFLGIDVIRARNNMVLTGPRGCGKSTVFKSLSLPHRLKVTGAPPDTVQFIGIYYRCDDLYFAFPNYQMPGRREAWDLPLHFITTTLLALLFEAIGEWGEKHFREEFLRIQPAVCARLWEVIGLQPPSQPNAYSFSALVRALQKERTKAAERQKFAHSPDRGLGYNCGVGVLTKACEALSEAFPFLRERPIYFFVDDYSSPKISVDLQRNLNRLLTQRTPFCFFKISTESPVSFEREDVDGKHYPEGREFEMLNLGVEFLGARDDLKLGFVEDVFARRFAKAAETFPVGFLEELLGSNREQSQNDHARQIRQSALGRGSKPILWGKETLCQLCSGDIHYLIGLVRDMVITAGGDAEIVKSTVTPRVPKDVQNQEIRTAAGAFLKSLTGIVKHGDRLKRIVEAFGTVAYTHLLYRDAPNQGEQTSIPKQATRIEPLEEPKLSPDAQRIYSELLRYSVFIEDVRGKSRRGGDVSRLYLRRLLIPHFNLTFSRRDSIELEPSQIEVLLNDPETFLKAKRLKGVSADEHPTFNFDPI